MAAGPNPGKLHFSEHLPNRHVTVCRPSFHSTLSRLQSDLEQVRGHLDKQQRALSSAHSKLSEFVSFSQELAPQPEAASPPHREECSGGEFISTLVRRRHVDRSAQALREIEEKYAKRMADVTARELEHRRSVLSSLRATLSSAPAARPLHSLSESSLYIRHYC